VLFCTRHQHMHMYEQFAHGLRAACVRSQR
jgi:hypothetical protein